jgi:mono/diheme cytochrome c family protein
MLLLLALGCPSPTDDTTPVAQPTWHGGVAPLVIQRCAGCHTSGAIGPFPLDSYAAAAPMAAAMVAAVDSGSMPPWAAESTDECQPRFGW